MNRKERLIHEMTVGALYESANNVKYEIVDTDERCIIVNELEPSGKQKYRAKRKFTKNIFADLIINKSFEPTKFRRREAYSDLRIYDVNKLFNR